MIYLCGQSCICIKEELGKRMSVRQTIVSVSTDDLIYILVIVVGYDQLSICLNYAWAPFVTQTRLATESLVYTTVQNCASSYTYRSFNLLKFISKY